jgi:hypothetical protein
LRLLVSEEIARVLLGEELFRSNHDPVRVAKPKGRWIIISIKRLGAARNAMVRRNFVKN